MAKKKETVFTKQDLVEKVATKAGITKKEAKAVVDAVFDSITEALTEGKKVRFVGFATFEVVKRKARTGVNPKTKEKIKIPAKKTVKVKMAKTIVDSLNK